MLLYLATQATFWIASSLKMRHSAKYAQPENTATGADYRPLRVTAAQDITAPQGKYQKQLFLVPMDTTALVARDTRKPVPREHIRTSWRNRHAKRAQSSTTVMRRMAPLVTTHYMYAHRGISVPMVRNLAQSIRAMLAHSIMLLVLQAKLNARNVLVAIIVAKRALFIQTLNAMLDSFVNQVSSFSESFQLGLYIHELNLI